MESIRHDSHKDKFVKKYILHKKIDQFSSIILKKGNNR